MSLPGGSRRAMTQAAAKPHLPCEPVTADRLAKALEVWPEHPAPHLADLGTAVALLGAELITIGGAA